MVNKIREVEDPARRILGPWRQRILLAADDDMAGGKPDDLANKHTPESEKVARAIEETNSAFELRKIYLFDYARDAKLQFPEATRDLIEAVNRGCAAVNYVGHGAHFGWADEQLFWSADADRLNNPGMYPLIFSASCSVGEFDLPSERTIYELMLRSPGKGACAAIGATRATYSDPNNRLNVAFFRQLLGASPFSQSSIGASLFQAKRAIADIGNSELYACFGDPALRLRLGQAGRRGHQGLEPLLVGGEVQIVQAIGLDRLLQNRDVRLGLADHGPVLAGQDIQRHHGRQQADDDDDHHQFDQGETLTLLTLVLIF